MFPQGDQTNASDSFIEDFINILKEIKTLFQISIQSAWANREISVEIRTSNVSCSDMCVVWRMTWDDVNYGEAVNPIKIHFWWN